MNPQEIKKAKHLAQKTMRCLVSAMMKPATNPTDLNKNAFYFIVSFCKRYMEKCAYFSHYYIPVASEFASS